MSHPFLFRALPQFAIGAVFASLATTAHGQVEYYRANTANSLNQNAAWQNFDATPVGTTPSNVTTSPDSWIWDSRVATNHASFAVNDLGAKHLIIRNPTATDPVTTLTIDGSGRTMTFANGGSIDLTTATTDLILTNYGNSTTTGLRMPNTGSATLAFKVPAGRKLTLTNSARLVVASNNVSTIVNFTDAGRVVFGNDFRPAHCNINAGTVEFNKSDGNNRLGTPTTTISNGTAAATLIVRNTSGSPTGTGVVTVNDLGTLAGTGVIGGAVTANSGATLDPGDAGAGTLSVASLNMASGSKLRWEGGTPTNDLVAVTANNGLTVNGGTVSLYNAGTNTPFTGIGTFNLISFVGTLGGAGVSNLTVAEDTKIAGQSYTFGAAAGLVTLTIEVGARPESFWNVNNSGTWATPANWTANGVPNAVSAIANLGGSSGTPITQPRTVTLAAPATVGVLKFNSSQSFTVAGTSALTFDDGLVGSKVQVIAGSHTISTPIAITANGLLASVDSAASTLTLGGQLDGTGGLSKSGLGTLVLTGDSIYLGTTSIGAGTVQVGNGATSGGIFGPITNSGTLRFNRTDDVTLNYEISGAGSVDFAGTGKTTLNVPNTFSGPTTITAGTVELADGTGLQNSTLTYSSTGGVVSIPDYLFAVTLGGLTGDKSFPLTNAIGDPISLTVGQNNSTTSYAPSTTGTGTAFTKLGSGTFTLTGTHAFSAAATVSAGVLSLDTGANFSAASVSTTAATGKLRINGGTIHVTGAGTFDNASAGFELVSGTANIDGAVTHAANISSGNVFINVNGGTLNAGSVSLSRCNFNLGTAEPANGSTSNGLYVHNNGVANVAGNVLLGNNANSSVSCRIETGGSLTVNGTTSVGLDSPDRWSILDIAAGSFTSTHVAGGVFLGLPNAGTNSRGQAIMHVRGTGVAKAERIQFGQAALGGQSILRVSGGELYVGSGGMVVGSSNPALVSQLRLEAGVLGALGDSTSTVPVNLNGPAVVTGSGQANEPHVMTFTGATTGTGSLTKNGAGTVLFRSASNNFSGPTTVNAGTLGLGGQTSGLVTVNTGTTLAPQGVLSANGGAAIDGTLSFAYDSLSAPRVPRVTSTSGAITLGAGSALVFTGSGTVDGSVHVLLKSAGGVTGTFATVTGLPANFTLDYAYDDDGNAGTPPVVAIINPSAVTPFSTWIQTYVTNGDIPANQAGVTQDPDGDGVDNGTEFAFDGDPGDGTISGKIFGLAADGEDADVLKQLLLTVAVRTGTSFTAGAPATGVNPDVDYFIDGSTILSAFTTGVTIETTVVPPPNAPALNSGWEWKTFSLTGSNGLTGKGFLRARATTHP